MSDEIKLSTFPSSKAEALTMLYLEQQDISNLTPSELAKKYLEVKKEIVNSSKTDSKQKIHY